MLKKLLERAAAKASLVNIKFDLDQLAESFPHSASRASNAIFKLLENITLAFENNASEGDVQKVLETKSASFPAEAKEIVSELFQLVVATRRGDTTAVNIHDSRINDILISTTGRPLDITKAPWLSKLSTVARD